MVPWQSLSVLAASPPRFSAEEAAAIAAKLFDLRGEAVDLGSERDQTFLFLIEDGDGGGVLKISNLGEDPPVLDLEANALLHMALGTSALRPSAAGDLSSASSSRRQNSRSRSSTRCATPTSSSTARVRMRTF